MPTATFNLANSPRSDWYSYQNGASGGSTGTTIPLGNNSSYPCRSGFVFTGVTIPQGATITNAYVSFKAGQTSSVQYSLAIKGHDVANSLPTDFETSGSSDWSKMWNAPRTTAYVSWGASPSTSGQWFNTPDIATVVSEITTRVDWVSGNGLGIFVDDNGSTTGYNQVYSRDNAVSDGATLTITWTEAAPTIPITINATTSSMSGLTKSPTITAIIAVLYAITIERHNGDNQWHQIAYQEVAESDHQMSFTDASGFSYGVTYYYRAKRRYNSFDSDYSTTTSIVFAPLTEIASVLATATTTAYVPTVTVTNGVINATITAGLSAVTTTAYAPTASSSICISPIVNSVMATSFTPAPTGWSNVTAAVSTVVGTVKAPTASGAITVIVQTPYANGQTISLPPTIAGCAAINASISTASSNTYSPTVSGAITVLLESPYIDVGISATAPILNGLANVVVDDIGSTANAMPVTPSTTQTVNLDVPPVSIGASAIDASLGGIVNRTVLAVKSTLTVTSNVIQVSTQQRLTANCATTFVDTVAPIVIGNAIATVDEATTYMMAFAPGVGLGQGATLLTTKCNVEVKVIAPQTQGFASVVVDNASAHSMAFAPGVGMHQGVTLQSSTCMVDIDSKAPVVAGYADVNINNADAYSVAFAPNIGIKQGITIQSVYSTASTQAKSPWVVLTKEILPNVATTNVVGIGSKIVSSNNLHVTSFSNWAWANMPRVIIHLYYLRLYGQINKMIAMHGDITSRQTLSGDVNIQVTKKGQW